MASEVFYTVTIYLGKISHHSCSINDQTIIGCDLMLPVIVSSLAWRWIKLLLDSEGLRLQLSLSNWKIWKSGSSRVCSAGTILPLNRNASYFQFTLRSQSLLPVYGRGVCFRCGGRITFPRWENMIRNFLWSFLLHTFFPRRIHATERNLFCSLPFLNLCPSASNLLGNVHSQKYSPLETLLQLHLNFILWFFFV